MSMKKFTDVDKAIARRMSDNVNGKVCDRRAVAAMLARDHRYLVNEQFKLFYEFCHILAMDYEAGRFDPRNEWACKMAHEFMQAPSAYRSKYSDQELMEYVNSVFYNQ